MAGYVIQSYFATLQNNQKANLRSGKLKWQCLSTLKTQISMEIQYMYQ